MTKDFPNRDVILESVVQALPYIGGPLSTLYFGHKQEKRFKRLENFYRELKEEMEEQSDIFANISTHNPDELSAILEELHEKVEMEHIEMKQKLYKNYFKKTLIYPVKGNYDERKIFLDLLGTLTPLQIELIIFLSQQSEPIPGNNISKPYVEKTLITGAMAQLKSYGVVNGSFKNIVLGHQSAINEDVSLSQFGRRFHEFCIK